MVRTFDPNKVTLIFDGQVITGFADDTLVQAEKNEDNVTPYVGVKGEVSRAINANKTGTITISLATTSPFIRILSQKATVDTIAPISMIDMNDDGINIGGTESWITKAPNINLGKEVDAVEVQFFVADYKVG